MEGYYVFRINGSSENPGVSKGSPETTGVPKGSSEATGLLRCVMFKVPRIFVIKCLKVLLARLMQSHVQETHAEPRAGKLFEEELDLDFPVLMARCSF